MRRSKKIILYIGLIIFFFFIVGTVFIFNSKNKTVKKITTNIPTPIKNFTRDKIFFLPKHFRNFNSLKSTVYFNRNLVLKLRNENEALKAELFSGETTLQSEIISKHNKKYHFKKIQLPWGNFHSYKSEQKDNHKRHGYVDIYNDYIYVVFFSGKILKFNKNNINSKNLETETIQSNILDFIINSKDKWVGVKDILILNNDIFVSYTKAIGDPKNDCYNTSVLKGSLIENFISFEEFFTHDDCTNHDRTGGSQAGGRMVKYNDSIILTIGDFKDLELYSTVKNRLFSKIISINLKTKEYKILSQGHRNPQGLLYLKDQNLLISSEHGPMGGDEINNIILNNEKIPDYGWPFVSYGTFYGYESTEIRKKIILGKNHKEKGYVEPILVFEPSIGPSEIVNNKEKNSNNLFFVSSLKNKTLYEFRYTNGEDKAERTDEILIGERIRDIINFEKNSYLMLLGDTGSLGILQKKLKR